MAEKVKCLPAMQETQVRSLGQEDLLETEMATHSSTMPGKFHGQRIQVGYSPWRHKESDMTEQLHFTFALLTTPKPLAVWITTNWKILQEMGIPENLACLLGNLYVSQEGTVRTGHGTTDWFQIRKGICQGCILSPCLFDLYAEYIMWNARLDEAQAGIKIAGRNINNLGYANDITHVAESEEELKSLLMKVKEESEKVGLKLNIQESKIMASSPIISWKIDGETVRLYFGGLQNHCRWWLQPWN